MNMRPIVLMAAVALGGCASVDIPTGAWTLRAPDGSESAVEVSALREKEYFLRAPGRTFGGAYLYRDKELSITKPDNPRMSGYVWKLKSKGELVLVEEPAVPVSGVRLTSAKLEKDRNSDD